jgi:serine/threonine protein kinase
MLTCRYCGTKNPPGSTYCNNCGGAFNASAAQSHAAAPAASAAAAARPAPSPAHAASATATPPGKQHNATGSLPPQTLLHNRYIVLKTVGQGGMAAVYRGIDTKTSRNVAIKEMSQDNLSPEEQKEALESFATEAAMLQRLQHPNLPRVWDRFSEGARHYLVMDFVDGETLEQRQQAAGGKALPEAEVMEWARQLCSVLAYLHSQRPPIIFRDLKPANVMLTKQGQIKLIDFGIARVFHPGNTKDTQVLGTPGFAPPEQYGKSQTDARADVYALGVTLYQLLTGYDPGTTPFSLPPANSRNPRIAPHIQAAIEHATRLDRDGRYATVAAFERDLLHPDGFVFRGGQRARTVPELVTLCRTLPQEAQEYLYNRRFESWLISIGQPETARLAAKIAGAGGNPAAGLSAFMTQAIRPQGQPRITQQPRPQPTQAPRQNAGARPQPAPAASSWSTLAGPGGAQASQIAARLASQVASKIGSQTARRLMAHAAAAAATMVGTQILVEVRPRVVNFGALIAGQPGQAGVTISGQNGLPVSGRVAALANWLRVDRTSFVGPLSVVQLSVDTSRMSPGVHQTSLQISSGSQQLYVPVSVDVLATQTTPKRPAPGPKAAPKRAKKTSRWGWFRVQLSERGRAGLSLGLGAALAGAGGVAVEMQEQAHAALVPTWMPAMAPVAAVVVLCAALGAALGRFEAKVLPRLFTALLLSALGVGFAFLLLNGGAQQGGSPSATLATNATLAQWLPWFLMYLGALLGAALGAAQHISARVLAGLAFLRRHTAPLLALCFITLGGVFGWWVTRDVQWLVPLGTVMGLLLATAIVVRTMHATRHRTAAHP